MAVISAWISLFFSILSSAGPLDVEDLAADRQDRLGARVAGVDGGAAGGVALDDEQLALVGVAAASSP